MFIMNQEVVGRNVPGTGLQFSLSVIAYVLVCRRKGPGYALRLTGRGVSPSPYLQQDQACQTIVPKRI